MYKQWSVKVVKRFATTEAEIEETRLKLNAERTIKQNKAAAAILKDYLFQKKMDIEFDELWCVEAGWSHLWLLDGYF